MIRTLNHYSRSIALFLLGLFCAESVLAYHFRAGLGNKYTSYVVKHYNNKKAGALKFYNPLFTNGIAIAPANNAAKTAPTAATTVVNSWAITRTGFSGGPGQPEASSFKSVNSNDMVDLFTGDFSYNIPLLDVGGYPVNIHYNSGVSMDEEASWVGLGWNLNPGTINRTVRGLPDDFDGTDFITKTQSIKPNKTHGVNIAAGLELFGKSAALNLGLGLFYNNYNGWGTKTIASILLSSGSAATGSLTSGLDSTSKRIFTAGVGLETSSQTGLDISPSLGLKLAGKESPISGLKLSTGYNSRAGLSALTLNTDFRASIKNKNNNTKSPFSSGTSSSLNFGVPSYSPTITMPLTNTQFSFSIKTGASNFGIFTSGNTTGYGSTQYIDNSDTTLKLAAYGYMHLSKNNSDASLLDFNREKEVAFNNKTTPHIALPYYTYDVYTMTGEGITGSFRPYRGDASYVFDHKIASKSKNGKLSTDIGPGNLLHTGNDLNFTIASTRNQVWRSENAIINKLKHTASEGIYEEVYFRNPGEITTTPASYYNQIGGDALINVQLAGSKNAVIAAPAFNTFTDNLNTGTVIPVNTPIVKDKRHARSQVISYFTAEDASLVGFDTEIRSYPENANPLLNCPVTETIIPRVGGIRKKNHLSEINVTNPDGRRYIYGLPAYNIHQEELQFSVTSSTPDDKGLTTYTPGSDNRPGNNKGKEGYFVKEVTPAHAHSFLLTGILSPDYVDVTGDGITEDDIGDGIKFNYSRIYDADNPYYWRTPDIANKATPNEGLKTYNRDDKASYIFGAKEVWYVNSIESKTMIALFKTSAQRTDAYSVSGVNGGNNTGKQLRRLDSIVLFAKADIIKNGANARPIKTVKFEYDYSLCKNVKGNAASGKLTLTKLWFYYNNNYKTSRNAYVFNYNAINPNHNPALYDRWGNYKSTANNPGSLNNADFPYTVQDSTTSGSNAAAWHLTDIQLPSGAKLKITYESDDYAFVQNKRAVRHYTIAGFGTSSSATPGSYLYTQHNGLLDNYVFVNTGAETVTSKAEVYKKYLRGLENKNGQLQLFFKVAVKMPYPNDTWNTGIPYEMVPVYALVEDYGTATSSRFWLKLKPVDGKGPITKAALQFLRLNLPSKAWPQSEPGDNLSAAAVIRMMAASYREILTVLNGFDKSKLELYQCREAEPDKSFVRLGIPTYKKYGGGVRVKKIEVSDEWNTMTNNNMKVAKYGQEYDYGTTYDRGGGDVIRISSGVAAYEPVIGADENAFRFPVEYNQQLSALGPTDYMYTESPLGEALYPGPSVGYSKVRVRTINAAAKSANGWTETEHYTTRDFPTIVDHTPIDKRTYTPKFNLLKISTYNYATISQGFRIQLNDMNGKLKATSIYAENDPNRPIHYSAYYYKVENNNTPEKKLSNLAPTMDAGKQINKAGELGKEVEIMVDIREQESNTFSANIQFNLNIIPGAGLPIPVPTAIPLPQSDKTRFRSIAVTKVVNRYGILDSVVVVDKGSVVGTKNMVYDGQTGEALVTRTNNEFNDPVYNFKYPARWAYSGMGMAYENMDLVLKNKVLRAGKLTEPGGAAVTDEKYLESGDVVWIQSATRGTLEANGTEYCGQVTPLAAESDKRKKLWVIDAAKGHQNEQGLYFIDEHGKPYTGIINKMRIIRSGKRNHITTYVGSTTTLKTPVKDISANEAEIEIINTTKAVNTSAITYNDLWKIDREYYNVDSCYTISTPTVSKAIPGKITLIKDVRQKNKRNETVHITNPLYMVASMDYSAPSLFKRSTTYRTKTILEFPGLSEVPANATINTANIELRPQTPNNLWNASAMGTHANFNWAAGGISWYYGAHSVYFRRIAASWNSATEYKAFADYDAGGQVSFTTGNNCEPQYVNFKTLVQAMAGKMNYGMMMLLQNEATPGSDGTRYLSLSSQVCTNYCAETMPAGDAPPVAAAAPPDCTPLLYINYSVTRDTCIKVCKLKTKDTINPYRWGLLGNWRVDKNYVYYGDRIEKVADGSVTSNIRAEGVLDNYSSYWSFSGSKITAQSADLTKWVWNVAPALYNRKGFEIENYDPLDRHNTALYGYNLSLPVAVVQNSRYSQSLFDGFEDYEYRGTKCQLPCAVVREFDFINGNENVAVDNTEAHSGKHSLAINSGHQAVFTASVASTIAQQARISNGIDSASLTGTGKIVAGAGTGLSVVYSCTGLGGGSAVTRNEGPLNFIYDTYSPSLPTPCNVDPDNDNQYAATWTGKIQFRNSSFYTLHATTPDVFTSSGAGITVTDPATSTIVLNLANDPDYGGDRSASSTVALQAGKLYDITVTYPRFNKQSGGIILSWSGTSQPREIIPISYLYPSGTPNTPLPGIVNAPGSYCLKGSVVTAQHALLPTFSPYQNAKMVVSAWIKTPGNCDNSSATGTGVITVSFNGSNSVTLETTGVPVEGWQRYEATVTVPAAATNMSITITAGNGKVLVDDIRMHPYNALMKSYAYDPVNLRLMAELDENNYATFYEYDDDGTLIRVKKETERGIMTVKETRTVLKYE